MVDWTSLVVVLVAFAFFYYLYRSGQTSAAVATEHQTPIPEGGLEAIEYFWRPG